MSKRLFSFGEIEIRLRKMTNAKEKLMTNVSREERQRLERELCRYAGWFAFYEIPVRWVLKDNKWSYRASDKIRQFLIDQTHESWVLEANAIRKRLKDPNCANAHDLERRVNQLIAWLESEGYNLVYATESIKIETDRETFHEGEELI